MRLEYAMNVIDRLFPFESSLQEDAWVVVQSYLERGRLLEAENATLREAYEADGAMVDRDGAWLSRFHRAQNLVLTKENLGLRAEIALLREVADAAFLGNQRAKYCSACGNAAAWVDLESALDKLKEFDNGDI